MKKYVKPELRFESYELNHSVADCGWELKFANEHTCYANEDPDFGIGAGGMRAFLDEKNGCDFKPVDYCYENSTGFTFPLFRS